MIGIEKFSRHFAGYENQYVLIGGEACELILNRIGEDFRTTKDLDVIVIIESLTPEFVKRFWEFAREAGYKRIMTSRNKPQFYRFSKPKDLTYPPMIELFSRKDALGDDYSGHIVSIFTDGYTSSLSAILLNDNYYSLLINNTEVIEGVTVLKAEILVLYKTKAFLDNMQRRENGGEVHSDDIYKHKRDIRRLLQTVRPDVKVAIAKPVADDINAFIEHLRAEPYIAGENATFGLSNDELIELMGNMYVVE
jgi:hypothetical protein